MFRLNMMAYSVAIVAALAAANNAAADTVVTIGEVSPLTGSIAHLGKDIANGAQLAVDEINATELMIGGQKVTLKLDTEDDAGDPRQATQVAQKLVDEKVVAVVGHMTSGTSIPASKIYSDAGIAQVTPSATNPAYTQQGFKTTFRLVATDAQQGPALAEYASKKLKIKTVAIVDDSTAYGQGLAEQFSKSATAFGVNVVSRDATNDKAVDFRSILTKIKGERPDAIMFGGSDASAGPFAKQARALGIKAIILGGDGWRRRFEHRVFGSEHGTAEDAGRCCVHDQIRQGFQHADPDLCSVRLRRRLRYCGCHETRRFDFACEDRRSAAEGELSRCDGQDFLCSLW
jgi:branched-chain amino acid transport system substrate-binding protein